VSADGEHQTVTTTLSVATGGANPVALFQAHHLAAFHGWATRSPAVPRDHDRRGGTSVRLAAVTMAVAASRPPPTPDQAGHRRGPGLPTGGDGGSAAG